MNEAILRPLADLLDGFLTTYRSLLGLEEQKHCALLLGDVAGLEVITQAEIGLTDKLSALEKLRQATQKSLARDTVLPQANLTDIIAVAACPAAFRLQELQTELHEVITQVAAWNRSNESLIQQSIRFVNCTVKLLTQAGRANLTYNASGGTGIPGVDGTARLYNRQV